MEIGSKNRGLYLSGVKVSENSAYHKVTSYHRAINSASRQKKSFFETVAFTTDLVDSYKKLVLRCQEVTTLSVFKVDFEVKVL